jgi:hypothetical protein
VLAQALAGKIPVRIAASRQTDLETAMQIAEELGLSVVFEEAQEAYKRADLLAKKNIPVLLRPSVNGFAPMWFGSRTRSGSTRSPCCSRPGSRPPPVDGRSPVRGSAAGRLVRGAARRDSGGSAARGDAHARGDPGRGGPDGQPREGEGCDLVVLSGEPHDVTTGWSA